MDASNGLLFTAVLTTLAFTSSASSVLRILPVFFQQTARQVLDNQHALLLAVAVIVQQQQPQHVFMHNNSVLVNSDDLVDKKNDEPCRNVVQTTLYPWNETFCERQ
jgi:hypothetical protein